MSLSLVLWTALYLTCNIIGVKMLEVALVAPVSEITQPALITMCLMGLAAVAICRMVSTWRGLNGVASRRDA